MDKAARIRYSRQIALPQIGKEGQERLLNSRVLIVGCGALGSMVAMQLAGAGVGVIGIADFDNIDISNLQRQFFYTTEEIGLPKTSILERHIKALNPEIKVVPYNEMLTVKKCKVIFQEYDFIVDATDNPESKRMIGTVAKEAGKPCCIGGIQNFSGQVMTLLPSSSRFEEFFGNASSEGVLPCSLGGVFAPAAAICASIQASETLKYLTQSGNLLTGQLLSFNLLTNSFRKFRDEV